MICNFFQDLLSNFSSKKSSRLQFSATQISGSLLPPCVTSPQSECLRVLDTWRWNCDGQLPDKIIKSTLNQSLVCRGWKWDFLSSHTEKQTLLFVRFLSHISPIRASSPLCRGRSSDVDVWRDSNQRKTKQKLVFLLIFVFESLSVENLQHSDTVKYSVLLVHVSFTACKATVMCCVHWEKSSLSDTCSYKTGVIYSNQLWKRLRLSSV